MLQYPILLVIYLLVFSSVVCFVLVSVVSFCCIMGALRNPSAPIPTIHYTLPRFNLTDPGPQPLRNPQKQGAILDAMTNPKITLGLTRGG